MKVVIVNSTHRKPHFGCKLVTSAYTELCEARDIEILHRVPKRGEWQLMDEADLIIVNAEGSIHHGKNENLLSRISSEYPAVLINGSMEELSTGASFDDFKLVTVRESMTQSYLSDEFGIACEVVPDVIFHHLPMFRSVDRTSVIDRFVSDSSSKTGSRVATLASSPQFLTYLARADEALLGRFHAICAAAMMRVPFVAWRANTWKNAGIMRDMGLSHEYRPEYEVAKMLIDHLGTLHQGCVDIYVEDARCDVNALFDRIAEL